MTCLAVCSVIAVSFVCLSNAQLDECSTQQCAKGNSLLQTKNATQRVVTQGEEEQGDVKLSQWGSTEANVYFPVSKKTEGCNLFIDACSPQKYDKRLWASGTFKEWELGFYKCCEDGHHQPAMCHGLGAEMFDFLSPTSSKRLHKRLGGTVVAQARRGFLKDFCTELGELVRTHFTHASIAKQILVNKPLAMLSARLRNVLEATQKQETSAMDVASKVQACQGDADCSRQVSKAVFARLGVVKPELLAKNNGSRTLTVEDDCYDNCFASHGFDDIVHCCADSNDIVIHCAPYKLRCGACGVRGWPSKCVSASFSGLSQVSNADGVEVPIGSLWPGDLLISPGGDKPATFMTDAHALDIGHETKNIIFLSISHAMMKPGRPLLITGSHLMFSSKDGTAWGLTRAADIKVGDYVQALKHGPQMATGDAVKAQFAPSKVTHIGQELVQGYWSPLTTSGRLVVDGVAVSSYAITGEVQEYIFDTWPWARRNVELFWHMALSPTRWWYAAGLPMHWLHDPVVAQTAFTVADAISGFFHKFGQIFQSHETPQGEQQPIELATHSAGTQQETSHDDLQGELATHSGGSQQETSHDDLQASNEVVLL